MSNYVGRLPDPSNHPMWTYGPVWLYVLVGVLPVSRNYVPPIWTRKP